MRRNGLGIYAVAVAAILTAGVIWAAGPVVVATGGTGVAGATGKASLTLVAVPPTTPIFSSSDLLVTSVRAAAGRRMPLQLTPAQNTADVTLGGATVTVAWSPPMTVALKANGVVTPLQFNPAIGGMNPVSISLNKTQKYVLAFPQATLMGGNKGMVLTYRSGGVQGGMIGGQGIALYDENADGVYTAEDSFRVDNGGMMAMFMPLSKYVSMKNGIFEIGDIAEDGSSLSYTAYAGKTGKMSWNPMVDPAVEVHAAYGSKTSGLNVELVSHGQAAEATALPGDYELLYGVLYSSRLRRVAGQIVPGSGGTLAVTEGGTVKADWGKPFEFEFKATKKGDKISISPGTIHIYGKGKEEYRQVVYEATPEVFLIADGRAVSLGRMAFG